MNIARFTVLCLPVLFLAACNGAIETEARYPTGADRAVNPDIYEEEPGIFGADGLSLLGGSGGSGSGENAIGVNSYLWRASLDTLSFLPLGNADPFGGVIQTDWYSPPETPDERLKVNALILSQELRSDAIRVTVFKQQQRRGGEWKDVAVSDDTARQLEDAILTRARQLRVADL